MTTFVTIQYGENEELIINPNCRQLTFMSYLRKKCQYDKKAFIDLLDENGTLANLHQVDPQNNVHSNFTDRLIYIPVMLEKIPQSENYRTIRPLLEDWEKTFPELEGKIKILTGEVKRPFRGLEARGRAVDRKGSSSNRTDTSGRSSVYLGRPPSNIQTGRQSTTNTGKPSAAGKMPVLKVVISKSPKTKRKKK